MSKLTKPGLSKLDNLEETLFLHIPIPINLNETKQI